MGRKRQEKQRSEIRASEISKRTAGMMEGWQEEDRIPQLNRIRIERGRRQNECP
jgi:hypothetical protein